MVFPMAIFRVWLGCGRPGRDFSHPSSDNCSLLQRFLVLGALSLALSSCGGGDSEQEKGLLSVPQEPGIQTPSPEPSATPSPSSTPSITQTPSPTASPTPPSDPGSVTGLTKPALSVEVLGDTISASWSDSSAEGYLLRVWPQDTSTVEETSVSITSYQTGALRSTWYLVMVEAYDEFGNGIFSDPVYVEVP